MARKRTVGISWHTAEKRRAYISLRFLRLMHGERLTGRGTVHPVHSSSQLFLERQRMVRWQGEQRSALCDLRLR